MYSYPSVDTSEIDRSHDERGTDSIVSCSDSSTNGSSSGSVGDRMDSADSLETIKTNHPHHRAVDRRSFATLSFPCKMHALLNDAESQGFDHIISWQVTGKSFKIHRPQEFVETVLKQYFSQSRLKSFQRQLNIYGFKKVAMGPQKGGYQHKWFCRGKPELCRNIVRQRPYRDLDYPVHTIARTAHSKGERFNTDITMKPISLEEAEVLTLYDFFYPQDPETRQFIQNILSDDDSSNADETRLEAHHQYDQDEEDRLGYYDPRDDDPVIVGDADLDMDGFQFDYSGESGDVSSSLLVGPNPATTITFKTPDSVVESRDPAVEDGEEDDPQEQTGDLSFPYKVHMMVENANKDNYSHIVSWTKDGKAFQVHDVEAFVKSVLPLFFDQSKYESFRRQLNLYQFKRVARGELRGTISHPSFVRGARWMCEDIKRVRCRQQQQQERHSK